MFAPQSTSPQPNAPTTFRDTTVVDKVQEYIEKSGKDGKITFPTSPCASDFQIKSLAVDGEKFIATFCYTPTGERTGHCRVVFSKAVVEIDNYDDMRYLNHHQNPEMKLLTILIDELSINKKSSKVPDIENPLIVYSPEKDSGAVFDPTPLIEALGKPSKYESAILITYREIHSPEVIATSWGDATADPDIDVVATPWILNQQGQVVPAGKDYPLKKVELKKREATEFKDPTGIPLLKKPGETNFFRIPSDLVGAIHVFSPESPRDGTPQIVKENDIIAFTETGPWVMQWNPEKFCEVKI